MRPVYVCQLPDKMQEELRGILERILLYHCGSVEKAEEYLVRVWKRQYRMGWIPKS